MKGNQHHIWLGLGVILLVANTYQLIVGLLSLAGMAIFWSLVGLTFGALISYNALAQLGGWRYFLATIKPKRKKKVDVPKRAKKPPVVTTSPTEKVVDLNSRRKMH